MNFGKTFRSMVILLLFSLQLSSYSVGMALSGDKNPNFAAIKVGASRMEIESQLGEIIRKNINWQKSV